jgi:hypothetical protein
MAVRAFYSDWPVSFWITAPSATMRISAASGAPKEIEMQPSLPTVILTGSERRSTFHSVGTAAQLVGFGRNTL